jgi:hypothetical protein
MNSRIQFFTEKFTEMRVDLLQVLMGQIKSGELDPLEAVQTFAKINRTSQDKAYNYMYLMSGEKDRQILERAK